MYNKCMKGLQNGDDTDTRKQELRKTIKTRVLERIGCTNAQETIHTSIAINEMFVRMRDMQDIPEDHKNDLRTIDDTEFRAVRAANLLAAVLGKQTRIYSTAQALGQSVH